MSCPYVQDGAAYVLGALSPSERLELERHLAACDTCTRGVRELAGLPGLLDRVDATLLEHPPADEPVPDSLLPALTREVRRGSRRRTVAAAGLAAAVVAAVALSVPVVAGQLGDGNAPPVASPTTSAPTTSAPSSGVVERAMAPVGDVPVRARIGFEPVAWGTRLLLTCSYEPESVEYALPPEVDYTLVVRTRGGRSEQVGSWRSVGGTTMRLTAATSVDRADIASVEVRTPEGRVVLRLTA